MRRVSLNISETEKCHNVSLCEFSIPKILIFAANFAALPPTVRSLGFDSATKAMSELVNTPDLKVNIVVTTACASSVVSPLSAHCGGQKVFFFFFFCEATLAHR